MITQPVAPSVWHIQRTAEALVKQAAEFGVVLTIEQASEQPPAMGHYRTVVSVREARPRAQPIKRAPAKRTHIALTPAEVQSGHDRVRWAEGLIRQLPADHDGRNSWLLNYGRPAPAPGAVRDLPPVPPFPFWQAPCVMDEPEPPKAASYKPTHGGRS